MLSYGQRTVTNQKCSRVPSPRSSESTAYLSQWSVGCWELCSCQPMPLFVPLPAKLIYSESLDTW